MQRALPLASSFSSTGSSAVLSCPIGKSSVTFTSYITKGGTCHAALFFPESFMKINEKFGIVLNNSRL